MANIGQELLNVPFPEMVKSMGMGIAQAQFELDLMGMRLAQMMSGEDYYIEEADEQGVLVEEKQAPIKVSFNGQDFSLLELGFTPTFYQFVDIVSYANPHSVSLFITGTVVNRLTVSRRKINLGRMSDRC